MARAIVIGAGVGGLAAAAALQHRGWEVTAYERAGALEDVGAGLAVAANALKALDTIGLGDQVRELSALQGEAGIARPDGRYLTRTSAEAIRERFGDPAVALRRTALIATLAGALRPGTVRFGTAVTAVDADAGRVTVDGAEDTADVVVAADGIDSATRAALLPDFPGPVYAGVTSWRLLAPLPSTPMRLGETWGRGQLVGLATLAGGVVYAYATAAVPPGGRATGPDGEKAELLRRFGAWHAPIPEVMASATEVLRTDIRCLDRPPERFHIGRVALLGDAAHAMTPHLGQGACQAIEDAVVLAALAGEPDGLARYTAARRSRTAMVAGRSRRVSRLTRLSGRLPVALRDAALRLSNRLGPGTVIRGMKPVMGWRPPA
jgi:2-polyprenyl-6-methoxyphenol hydroxylase-like FAD-dependent oxidoreductase